MQDGGKPAVSKSGHWFTFVVYKCFNAQCDGMWLLLLLLLCVCVWQWGRWSRREGRLEQGQKWPKKLAAPLQPASRGKVLKGSCPIPRRKERCLERPVITLPHMCTNCITIQIIFLQSSESHTLHFSCSALFWNVSTIVKNNNNKQAKKQQQNKTRHCRLVKPSNWEHLWPSCLLIRGWLLLEVTSNIFICYNRGDLLNRVHYWRFHRNYLHSHAAVGTGQHFSYIPEVEVIFKLAVFF